MATAMQAQRPRSNKKWRSLLTGLAFISPAIIGFLAFAAWPIVMSLYYSFTNYNVLQPPDFIGLDNYRDLFSDRLFHTSLLNTLYMVVIGLPIHLIFDFFMALLLATQIRGLSIYRTIFYLPSITPVVAAAIVWLWIFNGQYGILNTFLGWFGIQRIGWLTDPTYTKPSLIFMGHVVWRQYDPDIPGWAARCAGVAAGSGRTGRRRGDPEDNPRDPAHDQPRHLLHC